MTEPARDNAQSRKDYAARPLSIAVRADASSLIGTGHVFRCLALCDELSDFSRVVFICRDAPGHLQAVLSRRGYDVRMIPDTGDAALDAQATCMILAEEAPFDWLLVDHYGLDSSWERAVRGVARKLAVIDDLADRPHDADLLIDYMHNEEEGRLYDGLLPVGARRLIGHQYALLRREFFGAPAPSRTHTAVHRLLVTLGGSDPLGTTGLVLDALDSPEFAHFSINVMVGSSNERAAFLQKRASGLPNVTLHMQHERVSDLMRDADLCIGAGGTTSWERCYMGLPTLAIVLADNQRDIVAKLTEAGMMRNLGAAGDLTVAALRAAVKEAAYDRDWRVTCARRGQQLVDGKGVNRVIEALHQDRVACEAGG